MRVGSDAAMFWLTTQATGCQWAPCDHYIIVLVVLLDLPSGKKTKKSDGTGTTQVMGHLPTLRLIQLISKAHGTSMPRITSKPAANDLPVHRSWWPESTWWYPQGPGLARQGLSSMWIYPTRRGWIFNRRQLKWVKYIESGWCFFALPLWKMMDKSSVGIFHSQLDGKS